MLRRVAASGLRALKRRIPRAWRERAKAVLGRGRARRHVERRAPELDQVVPRGVKIEQLASGFGFTEGPVWLPEGHLLFADLPHNVIRKWDPRHGASVVRTRTGYAAADIPPGGSMGSNGMTLDGEGRLTICEPGNHRVTRQEPDGRLTVLADRFEGKRLNSPNDLVYKSDGALYFTDPPHGLPLEDEDPAKELSFNGVFRLADGNLTAVVKEMRRPNGLAFSPDEKYLYVSNSDRENKIWMRYEVKSDGSLADGMLFLDLNGEPGQEPDGMKLDRRGNLYLTGPGGLWITDPAGRILGVIRTTHEPANAAWGDADGKALYLTARSVLYRIRLSIEGIRPLNRQRYLQP